MDALHLLFYIRNSTPTVSGPMGPLQSVHVFHIFSQLFFSQFDSFQLDGMKVPDGPREALVRLFTTSAPQRGDVGQLGSLRLCTWSGQRLPWQADSVRGVRAGRKEIKAWWSKARSKMKQAELWSLRMCRFQSSKSSEQSSHVKSLRHRSAAQFQTGAWRQSASESLAIACSYCVQ